MRQHQVSTPSHALAYITDCNLATVCYLAGKKSKSKSEYIRQINIAQIAIDWMVAMNVDFHSTRAKEVIKEGSVAAWAAKLEPVK